MEKGHTINSELTMQLGLIGRVTEKYVGKLWCKEEHLVAIGCVALLQI